MGKQFKQFTRKETLLMLELAGVWDIGYIARRLNRSVESVRSRGCRHGIKFTVGKKHE